MNHDRLLNGRIAFFLLLLLALGAFSLKAVHIEHDSDPSIESSGDIYADEGYKTYSARNRLLFGAYKWSDYDEYKGWHERSPLITRLYILAFKLLGIHLSTPRYLSILFATGTSLLIFLSILAVGKNYLPVALLASAFIAFSYSYTMFARIGGFLEIYANFFIALIYIGCLLLIKSYDANGTKRKYALPGAFLVLLGFASAVGTKLNSLLSIVGVFLGLLFVYLDRRVSDKRKLSFFVSIFLIFMFVAYLLFSAIPFLRYSLYAERPIARLEAIPFNFLYLKFIYMNPLLFLLGTLYAFHWFFYYLRKDRERLTFGDSALVLAANWYLSSFLLTSAFQTTPLRYYLHAYLPLYILAAAFLLSSGNRTVFSLAGKNRVNKVIYAAAIFFVATNVVFFALDYAGLIDAPVYRHQLLQSLIDRDLAETLLLLLPVAAGAGVSALLLVFHRRINEAAASGSYRRMYIALFFLFNISLYAAWLFQSQTTVADASRRISAILADEDILAGDWAPVLGMNDNFRTIYSDFYYHVNIDSLAFIKPDYVSIKSEAKQAGYFSEKYPEEEVAAVCEQFRQFSEKYPGVITMKDIVYQFSSGPYHTVIFKADWGVYSRLAPVP